MDLFEYELLQLLSIVLIALLVQLIARYLVTRLVQKVVEAHHYKSRQIERQREQTLIGILRTASTVIIWVIASMMMLSVLEINVAALLTGAGFLGVIIGFGAQDTIKDFFGGIFVIVENQYRVGDIITIGGKTGMVESITVRVTRLRDLDGNLHIVPNRHSDTVTNMTFDYANVHINIGVSNDADIEKVKDLVNTASKKLADDSDWQDFVYQPITFLRVEGFDDSKMIVKLLGQVAPGKQWEVAGEFRRQLKTAFKKGGVSISFKYQAGTAQPD